MGTLPAHSQVVDFYLLTRRRETMECGVKPQHSKRKNPTPGDGEWGWKDAWFSEAGLLAATEDEGESTEAQKGGGGWLGDDAGLLELDSSNTLPPWRCRYERTANRTRTT